MSEFLDRRSQVVQMAAEHAFHTPLLASGFWTHNDIRDNVYMALHGMVYLYESGSKDFMETPEYQLCENVLKLALDLQDARLTSETYGHFPLGLSEQPRESLPNTLPVELMGNLLIFVSCRYPMILSDNLKSALNASLQHIYQSKLYMQPLSHYGHHEAKHTALKLLLGHINSDSALLQFGLADLLVLIRHLRRNGFREYGALPWFWHWVQAFICAWEVIEEVQIHAALEEMLELLWKERALFYLKGAWAGPHSRVLEHDVPEDQNILLDYIQFGDYEIPKLLPRIEGAGLYHYQISAANRVLALGTQIPKELFKKIMLSPNNALHTYLYKTKDYAIGGMWERTEEYMNEQHRWDITLPRRSGGNQAFFFQPGEGWSEQDARHASSNGEVLYHKNAVLSVYPGSEGNEQQKLTGFLPAGHWNFDQTDGYGHIDNVYIRFHLAHPFTANETVKGWYVQSEGPLQTIAMEALSEEEAAAIGLNHFEDFIKAAAIQIPRIINQTHNEKTFEMLTLAGANLQMIWNEAGEMIEKTIDEKTVVFDEYGME